ncbi:MAG TPA: KH domain-containing protein [Candidatus Fimadaptatus faecigallinarum]|uniref:RNA-binding protein KhpA n=1 Tax=Candidatus Fimadaptatus faecigallinarum TaxID=2840814 RepID=A0A9D1S4A0_9FIRM|nr:KH domain-containing protein [Candidatus Fimadaptatus faecigallinarum]
MAEQIDAVALVEFVAKSLVDNPDSVQVKSVDGPESTVIELHVSPDDMGKVIGKQGRIAKAMRTVVKAATAKFDKPVFVEIM